MIMHRFISAMFLLLTVGPAGAHTADIRVVLLGTGRPEPAMDRFGPATLVEAGEQYLLFDAGRGASQRLWQLKIPLGRIDAVFLTHLHSDHTVGLPDLWLTGWLPTPFGGRSRPLEVRGPKGTEAMMAGLRMAYQWDIRVRADGEHLPPAGVKIAAHDVTEGTVYEKNGVKVTAFLVDHGGLLKPAFGYRIDYAGRAVVISGDTRPNDNLVRHAEGADVLVHEVAAVQPELLKNSPTAAIAHRILGFHTSPEDAGRIFARVEPKLAVFTHVALLTTDRTFPRPTGDDVIRRARTTYPGAMVLGEDLMTIDVGQDVKVHPFRSGDRTRCTSALRCAAADGPPDTQRPPIPQT